MTMTANNKAVSWLLGLAGAVGGGAVGFFIYVWLFHQGFYAMIIPGAALGAAGGFLFRDRSPAFGIVCAILAILLGIFAEWWMSPFIADGSFCYFLTHLQDLKPLTFIMIALGGLCGFWFGQGQNQVMARQKNDG
jgi:hypothetical protein